MLSQALLPLFKPHNKILSKLSNKYHISLTALIHAVTIVYKPPSQRTIEIQHYVLSRYIILSGTPSFVFYWHYVYSIPNPSPQSRALCGAVCTSDSYLTLLSWPIVNLLILFILFRKKIVF